MASATRFIIHGIHITENLQHHKSSDVRRILEDKGFKESPAENSDEAVHFAPGAGAPAPGKQTTVVFGDGGFVLEEGGVTLED